jgi:hypothetical protein
VPVPGLKSLWVAFGSSSGHFSCRVGAFTVKGLSMPLFFVLQHFAVVENTVVLARSTYKCMLLQ